MRISGARVLLTGATGGIGAAIARELARRGGELTLTGRRRDVLEALAQEVGGRALVANLADPGALGTLVADAGRVDVLIANAALPASGRLETFSVEELDHALAVNLRAPMALTHALAPAMTARGSGQLVFVCSLSGKISAAGASIYSATKFGLRGFALGLRAELAPAGVGVSGVFPGFIRDAGMFADAGVALPRGVGSRSPQQVAAAVALAIERNRAEIDVAPIAMRLAAKLAGPAPTLVAALGRRAGAAELAEQIAAAQADKR